jgi:hypothetical protein
MKDGFIVNIPCTGTYGVTRVDQDDLLHSLQGLVGGEIEIITLSKFNALVIDEEGKLKGKARNERATKYLHALRPDMANDYIVGTALVVKIVPDDIAAYDLENYVQLKALPRVRAIVDG